MKLVFQSSYVLKVLVDSDFFKKTNFVHPNIFILSSIFFYSL